eukprot:evm.model.NODE_29463_length_78484_cov_36.874050.14
MTKQGRGCLQRLPSHRVFSEWGGRKGGREEGKEGGREGGRSIGKTKKEKDDGRRTYLFVGQEQKSVAGATLLEAAGELGVLCLEEELRLAQVREEVRLVGTREAREGGKEEGVWGAYE